MKDKMRYGLWAGIFLIILPFCMMAGEASDEDDEVTLTVPLFFENRIPNKISEIETAVDKLVYEKIGVRVQLIPMLRMAKADVRRSTEMLLLQRGGVSFDLLHASMPDSDFLELTDLLPVYGEGILELFRQNGQDLLEGQEIFAIPSFSDYVDSQGIAMRKDIIDKYEIDISNLHTYDDFDKLFSYIAPLEPDMKMISSYSTSRGLLYRYVWNDFSNTVFCVSPGDALSVSNRYDTPEYEHLVRLFRGWYEKGYTYEYSALQDIPASDLVRAGILFSFVCAYKPGIETETSNSCGTEMVVVQTIQPVITENSLTRGCWGISEDCPHPEEAMKLLNLLYTDKELVNLLANGLEDTHYSYGEEGIILPLYQEKAGEAEFLNDAAWILPNQFLLDIRQGDDPVLWEKVDAYNSSASDAPNLYFSFDSSKVEEENERLNEIADEYSYGLETGQLDPDVYLEEMLEKMRQAGEEKVYQELKRQYKSWRSKKEE